MKLLTENRKYRKFSFILSLPGKKAKKLKTLFCGGEFTASRNLFRFA
jgi:hypothetical protein